MVSSAIRGLLTILAALLAFPVIAQNDPSPRDVAPQSSQAQQPSEAPPAQPATKPVKEYSEEEETPPEPVKEYSEDEEAPPAKAAAAAPTAPPLSTALTAKEQELRAIAQRFAPVIYQRIAGTEEEHRFDYPTNFDFDGDWVGSNNWANSADPRYKLWSFVYYSVIEGEDHYYFHYAVYHPRDWSVVQSTYDTILDKVQEKYGEILGAKTRKEVEFNHENDLEGVLVIVAKHAEGGPAVIAMETVAHNHLLRWVTPEARYLRITSGLPRQRLRLEHGRPVLYIESQKHGIHGLQDEQATPNAPILVLRYGKSMEFSQVKDFEATYELVSLQKTWWKHGRETHEPNQTFGTVVDFGDRFCAVAGARRPDCELGKVGGAIRGDYARPNAASAPWNWIDLDDESLPPGSWFFDPASILRRHFGQFDSEERYVYNPYLGILADALAPAQATAR